jgi:hypothetical protein
MQNFEGLLEEGTHPRSCGLPGGAEGIRTPDLCAARRPWIRAAGGRRGLAHLHANLCESPPFASDSRLLLRSPMEPSSGANMKRIRDAVALVLVVATGRAARFHRDRRARLGGELL